MPYSIVTTICISFVIAKKVVANPFLNQKRLVGDRGIQPLYHLNHLPNKPKLFIGGEIHTRTSLFAHNSKDEH